MIKLTSLLQENPDTLKYGGKYYRYTSPANRSAFFVYRDKVTHKKELFGYSDIKKEFFSSDPSVVTDIEELEQQYVGSDDSDKLYYINRLRKGDNGGGHSNLESILYAIDRNDNDSISRARIFEVDGEDGKKVVVCSFWDGKSVALEYMDFWKKAIEFNGYKPEEILYEPYKGLYTYEQFLDPNYTMRPDKVQISGGNIVKVGDKVVYYYNSSDASDPYNPRGVIDSILDEDRVTIKFTSVTKPGGRFFEGNIIEVYPRDLGVWKETPKPVEVPKPEQPAVDVGQSTSTTYVDGFSVGDVVKFKSLDLYAKILSITGTNARIEIVRSSSGLARVGEQFNYPLAGLHKAASVTTEEPIAPMLDNKTDVFIEKRAQLHTTAARFTPQEKQNLEREVDTLELEIKKLQSFIDSGITTLNDARKKELEQYVKDEMAKKHAEKKDRYSLIAQAEKQYGMPIAQIRQKFRGIPLDQLVKKESLYKRIMRQQIMLG